jgi:hypothetical protein
MYCPHCGNESSGELNYCKRCGGSLNPLATGSTQIARPAVSTGATLVMGSSLVFLLVLGLVVLFFSLEELSRSGLPVPVLVLMVIFGSLTLLGGATLLTFLWTRIINAGGVKNLAPFKQQSSTSELPPARISALPDAHIPSVTEHTTRTFDHARK